MIVGSHRPATVDVCIGIRAKVFVEGGVAVIHCRVPRIRPKEGRREGIVVEMENGGACDGEADGVQCEPQTYIAVWTDVGFDGLLHRREAPVVLGQLPNL